MFDANYIIDQCTQIHADNRKKGFWDAPRSAIMLQGLIVSEIMEAFEGLRKNNRINCAAHVAVAQSILAEGKEGYAVYYEQAIKDTVEAELAGTCIRCFDAIGGRFYEGGGIVNIGCPQLDVTLNEFATQAEYKINSTLGFSHRPNILLPLAEVLIRTVIPALRLSEMNSYTATLDNMTSIASHYKIDLKTHIMLECAYNRTRAHKHGKTF